MKAVITLLCCLLAILATLMLRSRVYEIADVKTLQAGGSSTGETTGKPIRLYYHERRPYYVTDGEEVMGVVADPITLVFRKADIPFFWVRTPAARQLDLIRENRSLACAAGWFKTPERERFARYTLPVYRDRPFVGITRADNELLAAEETLDRVFQEGRLRLLIKSGYSYGTYIDSKLARHTPWQIRTTTDNYGMLKMIRERRADYCFMTEEEASDPLAFTRLNRRNFKIIRFMDIPEGNSRYIICSQKVPQADIDRLDGAIRRFLSPTAGWETSP